MAGTEKNLHEGHRERLRQRFLREGLESFQEHEVLELLLTYAIPRADVNGTAHRLMERYGSLAATLNAPLSSLTQVEGVGERAAAFLKLMPQLLRRFQLSLLRWEREGRVDSIEKAGRYLLPYFVNRDKEQVWLLCLDQGEYPLNCVCLAEGSEAFASLAVKNLVAAAVREGSDSVILAHNHPRGVAMPSREDVAATVALSKALELVGVRLVDHLIVVGEEFASLAECGFFAGSWEQLQKTE